VTTAAETDGKVTIDELARRVEIPVRTIREYHTMRLLPAPERQGRIGLYDQGHIHRLELIARLQQRGYSLAGIRDLLEAWDTGTGLADLLGVDRGVTAVDEAPLRLTRQELTERLPGLRAATLRKARTVGLVLADGPDHVLVRSPALLGLAADAVRLGIDLGEMLDLIGVLIDQVDALAQVLADSILDQIWEPVAASDHSDDLPGWLARGRLLLIQGVASTLADRLGAALLHRAADKTGGDALRSAIDRVRVGVVTDSTGAIHQRID
jgi:DNA-binding transcriptional MerR regulator